MQIIVIQANAFLLYGGETEELGIADAVDSNTSTEEELDDSPCANNVNSNAPVEDGLDDDASCRNNVVDSSATQEKRLDTSHTNYMGATTENRPDSLTKNRPDAPQNLNHLQDSDAAKDNEFDATLFGGDVAFLNINKNLLRNVHL